MLPSSSLVNRCRPTSYGSGAQVDSSAFRWHASGTLREVTNTSLDERVALLEKLMGGKTLEEHFREHAELIDRRFAEVHARFAEIHARFTAQDKRFEAIDARFVAGNAQFVAFHARLEVMDERFNRVDHELAFIRRDLGLVLQKLDA